MTTTEHSNSINALIPLAAAEATRIIGYLGAHSEVRRGVDGKPFTYDFWTLHYHAAMNRMAIEAGLRIDFSLVFKENDL